MKYRSRRNAVLLPTAFLAFLLLFVLYPSTMVLLHGFSCKGHPGMGNLAVFFERPHFVKILWQSGAVATLVAVASTLSRWYAYGKCVLSRIF